VTMNFGRSHAPSEREYLFIDGGCLRATVRKICQDLFGKSDVYQPAPGDLTAIDRDLA